MDTPGMRLLKAAVIFMGLLLVAGIALLIMRAQEKAVPVRKTEKIATLTQLAISPQGRVETMSPMGEGVALLINAPEAGQELILLDSQGEVMRRIHLQPTATR